MKLLRSFDPQLPREVWLLQLGGVMNSFGNGLVLPFLVIYLHDVRGFGLGVSGLVVAVSAAAQLTAGLVAGPLVDRLGPRRVLGAGLVLQGVGFGLFPLVESPWHAFVLIAVEGAGSAGFWPSQSTLIARLTPPARRHAAYAQQRVTMNLGIGLGGLTGGLIATTSRPSSFTVLFVVDAASYLGMIIFLPLVPEPELPEASDARPSGYLDVLRDRVFVSLITLNVAYIAAGYAPLELLPVFAKNEAGVSERFIGLIFLVNTLALVVAQLPVAKRLEGRRRMPALAVMPALFAVAWLIVLAGGAWLDGTPAALAFAAAAALVGLGSCLQGPTQGALVADLAPPQLRGRYMALSSMSWEIGFVIGPAAGGFILASAPLALWPIAAAICAAAVVGTLALERALPRELVRTPA
jgi:MFS family permease